MSIDELCALPVETLAEKDCLLFLWATFPQLPEALRLIKAWGFSFKTVAFVWLKLNRKSPTWFYGLGYWTRGNAEICLLAKRGHPKRYSKSVHQAKPGDLVFFVGTYDTAGMSHVGLYVGNSVMLHCGDPISYTNLNSSYWQQHFYCYGRLP